MIQVNFNFFIFFTLSLCVILPFGFFFIYKRAGEPHLFELFITSVFHLPLTISLLILSYGETRVEWLYVYMTCALIFSNSAMTSSLYIKGKTANIPDYAFISFLIIFAVLTTLGLNDKILIFLYLFIMVSYTVFSIIGFLTSRRFSVFSCLIISLSTLVMSLLYMAPLFLLIYDRTMTHYFVLSNFLLVFLMLIVFLDTGFSYFRILNQIKDMDGDPFFLYDDKIEKIMLWNDSFASRTKLTPEAIRMIRIRGIQEGKPHPVIIRTNNKEPLLFYLSLWRKDRDTGHNIYRGKEVREDDSQENDFFKNLYKFTDSGVAVYEAVKDERDFIFYDVNPVSENLLNLNREAIIGKRLSELIPSSKINGLLDGLVKCYESREKQMVTVKDYKNGKIEYWVENCIFPLTSDRIVSVFNNQTEKVVMQNQINQLEKMEQLGHLTGGVAHDFNNQLAIILGYSDLIKSRTDDDIVQKFLENINKSVEHSRELTSKLLSYSRDEEGIITELCINKLIRDFVSVIKHTFDKRIDIGFIENTKDIFILGNENLLQNLLLNLAINARDAMHNCGTLEITLTGMEMESRDFPEKYKNLAPGHYAKIQISDSGCGMETHLLERIFEPLFTTKDSGKGTGMGLSMVLNHIDFHKGAISVTSERDIGTRFTIWLPLISLSEKPVISFSDSGDKPLDVSVLIIDDEDSILQTLSQILESYQCRVRTSNNGRESVEIYSKSHLDIDLVLLDYTMMDMNGMEIFRILKSINPSVKVIVYSGYVGFEEQKFLLEEGALKILMKPIDMSLLIANIREVLDADRMALG